MIDKDKESSGIKHVHIQMSPVIHKQMEDVKQVAGSVLKGKSDSYSWRDILLLGVEELENKVEDKTGGKIEDILENKELLGELEDLDGEEDVNEILEEILEGAKEN